MRHTRCDAGRVAAACCAGRPVDPAFMLTPGEPGPAVAERGPAVRSSRRDRDGTGIVPDLDRRSGPVGDGIDRDDKAAEFMSLAGVAVAGHVGGPAIGGDRDAVEAAPRSEEHTSELQSPCNLV